MSLNKTIRLYLACLFGVTTLLWPGFAGAADLLKFQAYFEAASNAEKIGDIKLACERYELARQDGRGGNLVEALKHLAELSRRSLDKAGEADSLDEESHKEAKALEADAKSFDEEFKKLHQGSTADIDDLVRKCFRYNRFQGAEKLLRRKREILEKSGQKATDESARTLHDLGEACLKQAAPYGVVLVPNKLDDAENFLNEAIRVRCDYLGKEKHVLTVPDRAALARVLILEKKLSEASNQLSLAEEIVGTDTSPDVARSRVELLLAKGSLNSSLKQFKEAETSYKNALGIFERSKAEMTPPPAVPDKVVKSRDDLVQLAKNFDHKYAVVIGISRFENPNIKLNYASDDALEFANFLVNEANFEKSHINLLRDEDATCQAIKRALMGGVGGIGEPSWLRRLTFPGDLVVIFISTHGKRVNRGGTQASYLIPYDYQEDALDEDAKKVIELDRLIKEVRTEINTEALVDNDPRRAGNVKLVIFADACFSGGGAAGVEDLAGPPELRAKDLDYGNQNVVFISSSAANEESWELPAAVLPPSGRNETKAGAGAFHYFLLDALRSNNDLASVFAKLQTNVEVNLKAIKGTFQTPQMQPGPWIAQKLSIRTKPTKERAEPILTKDVVDPRSRIWRKSPEPFYEDLDLFGRRAGK